MSYEKIVVIMTLNNYRDCYTYGMDGSWKIGPRMVAAKTNNAIVPSPFSTNSQDFFIVGGYGPISQTEVLTESGWQLSSPSFPVTVYHHCLLLLNSTAAIVIGGIQNSITTANTYIITNGNRVMFFGKSFNKWQLKNRSK